MKKVLKKVNASTNASANECFLSPTEVYDFLMRINELRQYNITFSESTDGSFDYYIGNSAYKIYVNGK